MIKQRFITDVEAGLITTESPRKLIGNSKYLPHQGNREKMRRLERIYHAHPHDCPCKSCELMDAILKSKGIME